MGQIEERISENVKRVAGTLDKTRFPMMSGKVVSVDNDKLTCKVKLTVNDPAHETDGIMLGPVTLNNNGIVLYPAEGSNVVVGEVDGPGKWTLVKCSDLVKTEVIIGEVSFMLDKDQAEVKQGAASVLLKGGKIELSGAGKGGLVQIAELKDNLDTLKNYIKDTLETAISSGFDAVGAGMASSGASGKAAFELATLTEVILFDDMENENVKHG